MADKSQTLYTYLIMGLSLTILVHVLFSQAIQIHSLLHTYQVLTVTAGCETVSGFTIKNIWSFLRCRLRTFETEMIIAHYKARVLLEGPR